MTTKRPMTKQEIAQSSAHRYHCAFSWLTLEETRVIQHALEAYVTNNPDNSWPIKLAADLLKGSGR